VADPIARIRQWLDDATAAGEAEPTAMTLATAAADGAPSARMVLLRGLDDRGLAFYTNRHSAKGRDLAANPRAALVLHWQAIGRQVRVTGPVELVSDDESDAYWNNRPVGSRLSAAVSPQSEVIPDREGLEQAVEELRAAHPDGNVPRPGWWGGYRVVPDAIEFWTHRENRLHERVRFTRDGDGWREEILGP
jgi:pyridoxamine 5'-phosphate oxidase